MANAATQADLFPEPSGSSNTIMVNDRVVVRAEGDHRAVVAAGIAVAHFDVGDQMAAAYATVLLVEQGLADQNDVARAFGLSARTVRRHQRRFATGGLAALGRGGGYPRGRTRLRTARLRRIEQLKAEGLSNRAIAHRLGVSEKAVRKLLRRLGWRESRAEQGELPLTGADPNLSASATGEAAPTAQNAAPGVALHAPVAAPPADPNLSAFSSAASGEAARLSLDRNPADRRLDRLLACLGLLDDAAPLFESATRVPRAGILLAVPALVASGVLDCARDVYATLGPAFYGLRTTVVAMLFLALLRIKRPEALKEHAPVELGRLLGLDRAPEVKTLRRKLSRLAALGRSADFGRALAQRRVAERGRALGFLYVDGHVRAYHGKRTLPKAHVARMRLAMPATTDYWVNDSAGDPLFVVTAEANAGLFRMLPEVLGEVRTLLGDERRVTVVFDRGGWSPKLFARLLGEGFDILTYRKGRCRRVPRSRFQRRQAVREGCKLDYLLADQGVRLLGGRLRLRQVTRLSDDGLHQTHIVTSRRDLSPGEVAFRMFERWRQENFFKYLREEYALDALVDYQVEADDPEREVPNPARRALEAKLRVARAEVHCLAAHYGTEAITNPEARRPTMRGFKIAHAGLTREVIAAVQRLAMLQKKYAAMPRRVPVRTAVEGDIVRLATERKHLTNLLKMVAYQAESDLVRVIAPHYRRAAHEGRTLVQTALASAADIEVTDTELRVTLAPLSSAHRSRAVAALCHELNATATAFPGTSLRLRYAVAGPA